MKKLILALVAVIVTCAMSGTGVTVQSDANAAYAAVSIARPIVASEALSLKATQEVTTTRFTMANHTSVDGNGYYLTISMELPEGGTLYSLTKDENKAKQYGLVASAVEVSGQRLWSYPVSFDLDETGVQGQRLYTVFFGPFDAGDTVKDEYFLFIVEGEYHTIAFPEKFCDYSWDEFFEVPPRTFIRFATNVTKQQKSYD